jgi:hypothetical protein
MGKAIELRNTIERPATDEAIVRAAVAFANGAALTLRLNDKTLAATPKNRRELASWMESAIGNRDKAEPVQQDFVPLYALIRGLRVNYVVVIPGDGNVRLEFYRDFKTVRSVLGLAVALMMDREHEFGSQVCRCKWQKCEAPFFLAQQNPKGGPPNRTYCSPEHMKGHHNSAKRRLGKE